MKAGAGSFTHQFELLFSGSALRPKDDEGYLIPEINVFNSYPSPEHYEKDIMDGTNAAPDARRTRCTGGVKGFRARSSRSNVIPFCMLIRYYFFSCFSHGFAQSDRQKAPHRASCR